MPPKEHVVFCNLSFCANFIVINSFGTKCLYLTSHSFPQYHSFSKNLTLPSLVFFFHNSKSLIEDKSSHQIICRITSYPPTIHCVDNSFVFEAFY